jgi:hypothetical protein
VSPSPKDKVDYLIIYVCHPGISHTLAHAPMHTDTHIAFFFRVLPFFSTLVLYTTVNLQLNVPILCLIQFLYILSKSRLWHFMLFHRLALLTFHSALVNSPHDAQVIRAFAALMYFGSWEGAVNFLNQDIGAPAPFIPETLGPSRSKLENLMEQTSHLASLVKSSVDTLTSIDALQQSLAKYSKASQVSGLVSISLAYVSTPNCHINSWYEIHS